MKIAILSMQRVVNFGSVLQAYSLREILRELTDGEISFLDAAPSPGLESQRTLVESVDYETPAAYPPGLLQRGKRWTIARLSAHNKTQIRRFMAEELGISENSTEQTFDHVVVGSDEVFNHTQGVRLQFHGQIPQGKNCFAYAASCGSASAEDIASEDVPLVREAMGRFRAVSVRDEGTAQYVSKLYHGPVEHHLDPVLVGPLSQREPRPVKLRKYALIYAYGQRIRTAEEISAIQAYARAHGLKTVAMGGSQFWCDLYLPADPMRLMDYFHSADCVITDTFHGAVFSVIHHKPFAVIGRRTNQNKLTGLLKDLALEDQLLPDMASLESVLSAPIDYHAVDVILDRERKRTRDYLKNQLKAAPEILLQQPETCSGCGACMEACPKQAIAMVLRPDGSAYPRIDETSCIHCGLCQRVCVYGKPSVSDWKQQGYAAVCREDSLVKNSASGGVFAALASSCIFSGGMTAGAVMDFGPEGPQVYHLLSGAAADLGRMQGSKYVQSEAWHCYAPVKKALREGKTVLFSGTPCQAAAVKALTGDPENLITIDLICHGTPPQKLLRDYCKILESYFRGKLTGLCFRDKSVKKNFCARLELTQGKMTKKVYLRSRFLSFYDWFLKGALYRENCYSCPYATLKRAADLTMGDYWGIETVHAEDFAAGRMPRRSDWSCLLVNSEKGRRFLDDHGETLLMFPSQPEWIALENQQLRTPMPRPENRELLLKLYTRGGYAALESHFVRASGGKLRYAWRLLKNNREHLWRKHED